MLLDRNSEHVEAKESILREIIDNFGDPFELIRELLSNSKDAGAGSVTITIGTYGNEGKIRLNIKDDGSGMKIYKGHDSKGNEVLHDQLKYFFELGKSDKRYKSKKSIGHKGFGSKISFICERIEIRTVFQDPNGQFIGRRAEICNPYDTITKSNGNLELSIEDLIDENGFTETYTEVIIDNFNNGQIERLIDLNLLEEHIRWFTVGGSVKGYTNQDYIPMEITLHDLRTKTKKSFEGIHNPPDNVDPTNLDPSTFRTEDRIEIDGNEVLLRSNHFCEKVKFDKPISDPFIVNGQNHQIEVCAWIIGKSMKDRFASEAYKPDRDRFGLWLAQQGILVERNYSWISESPLDCNFHIIVNCDSFELNADRTKVKAKNQLLYKTIKRRFLNDYKPKIIEVYNKFKKLKEQEKKEIKYLETRFENKKKREALETREEWPFNKVNLGIEYKPENEWETCMILAAMRAKYPEKFNFKILTTSGLGTDAVIEEEHTATGTYIKKTYEIENELKDFTKHGHSPDLVDGIIAFSIGGTNDFRKGQSVLQLKSYKSIDWVSYDPIEKSLLVFNCEKRPTKKDLVSKTIKPLKRIPVVLLEDILTEVTNEIEESEENSKETSFV